MTARALTPHDTRLWTTAGVAALVAHGAVAALLLGWSRPAEPPVPEPVVLIELPGSPELASEQAADPQPQSAQQPQQQAAVQPVPQLAVPVMQTPPPTAVTLPQPTPVQPARPIVASAAAVAAPAAAAPAPVVASAPATAAVGTDPRAKKQELDYYSLVSAHLNRRKTYPVEARQARQQGVVTVRFTVDRGGGVSNVSIKRGSGHAVLDSATLALVQRVAPLPRMPSSMQRDAITLSLPIDYSLRTD